MSAHHSTLEAAILAARDAYGAVVAQKADIEQERRKLDQISRDIPAELERRARLIEIDDRARAIHILDGEQPDDESSASGRKSALASAAREKKIAESTNRYAGLKAAFVIQKARNADQEGRLPPLVLPFNAAVMKAVSHIQAPAVTGAVSAFVNLVEPFTELLAADLVRDRLLGDHYDVPVDQVPPFSGGVLIDRILKAIPARFLPPELDEARLAEAANRMAATIIARIEGESK